MRAKKRKDLIIIVMFLFPAIVIFACFIAYPVGDTIFLSANGKEFMELQENGLVYLTLQKYWQIRILEIFIKFFLFYDWWICDFDAPLSWTGTYHYFKDKRSETYEDGIFYAGYVRTTAVALGCGCIY